MHRLELPKFSAFLLAARHLHEVLPKLWQLNLASERGRLEMRPILNGIEYRLKEFFENCRSEKPKVAAMDLAARIDGLTTDVVRKDKKAGKMWKEAVEKINAQAATWDFEAHIEELHQTGRNAACEFFKRCPVLSERLERVAPVSTLGNDRDDEKPRMKFTEALGIESFFYFEATSEKYYDWYVALPFRFVHEYTAHIFAIDARLEYFSDGWMMEAAGKFVRDCYMAGKPHLGFSEAQADWFGRVMKAPMLEAMTAAGRGVKAASAVHTKLELANGCDRQRFFDLTLALCSYDPKADADARLKRMTTFYRNIERLAHKDGTLIADKLNQGVPEFLKEMAI